jgi:hypothetical protein
MIAVRVIAGSCLVFTLGACEMFQPTGQMSTYNDSLAPGAWQQKGVLIRFTPPSLHQTSQISEAAESLDDER